MTGWYCLQLEKGTIDTIADDNVRVTIVVDHVVKASNCATAYTEGGEGKIEWFLERGLIWMGPNGNDRSAFWKVVEELKS